MNEQPSVHDVVTGSLDRHARAIGAPAGDLADVLRRVDRRRARRRSTAVVGSALAVGAGALGIVLVAAPAGVPAPGDGDPDATVAASWGCTGFLSSDGTADYYAACQPFADVVRPTAPLLPPATSVVAVTAVPSTIVPGTTLVAPTTTTTTLPTVATSAAVASTMSDVTTTTTTTSTVPISGIEHVVVAGDSVSGIATMYGMSPPDLVAFNRWADGIEHPLQVGDVVAIPLTKATVVTSVPSVCETSFGDARVTVPCSSAVPSTVASGLATPTAPQRPVAQSAYRCTGALGADTAYTYYLSCEPVAWDAVPTMGVPTMDVPTTVAFTPAFATSVPTSAWSTTAPPVPPSSISGVTSPIEQYYTVAEGDSLYAIADLYGIDVEILVAYNDWDEGIGRLLLVGDVVKIPPGSRIP